jgi:phytoene synthase
MARDTNFYYSFLALPAEKRDAIIAVWDFCRAADDAVDGGSIAGSGGAVTPWREEVARCFGAGVPQTSQGRRLEPFVRRFNLPRQAFEDLLDGVEMDVQPRRYRTFEELYPYCYRVASAVGLICIEVFGYRNPSARQYAIDLGVALQLTNIIRDVPADLAQGRLYLPLEDLARAGCAEADLAAGRVSAPVSRLLASQCARAREYYRRAAAAMPREDRRRLVAAEIMGAIYFAILEAIERREYDVFSRVVRVPRPRRAAIAMTTWMRNVLNL